VRGTTSYIDAYGEGIEKMINVRSMRHA